MAVTTAATVDVSRALSDVLADIDARVYWYVADTFRPPGIIVGLPTIDYGDVTGGYCTAVWSYPVTVIVSRNSDQAAQESLSRLVSETAQALNNANPNTHGVMSIDVQTATPVITSVAGQELSGYQLRVMVRA